ncbi:MAG: universal stress protein E [Mariniblastus sp.]|jgi:universal stress protein E
MHRFKKILVAVDLADDLRFVADTLPAPTKEAIRQAERVAKSSGSHIQFIYVLPTRAEQMSHDRQILMAQGEDYKSVFDHAGEVLSGIAELTSQKGIQTSSKVVFGKSWLELIREAIRSDANLVIAGTRRQGPFRTMLFGSTGIKLLRKCPCPVWVTKPEPDGVEWVDSILVAFDLTDVGDAALELGCSMAQERGTILHVLHSIEYQNPASDAVDASKKLDVENAIREQLQGFGFDDAKAKIQVDIGNAEESILSYIEQHDIKLIVMGTVSRTGIASIVIGNTAEKLLPFLPCSVLAIKPAEFKSPVLLSSDEYEDELNGGLE